MKIVVKNYQLVLEISALEKSLIRAIESTAKDSSQERKESFFNECVDTILEECLARDELEKNNFHQY